MIPAHEQLIGYLDDPHFWKHSRGELEPLWLEGANRRLSEQRERIPVLGRLAEDAAIKEIRRLGRSGTAAIRPLQLQVLLGQLSSQRNRWDLMNRWLDTLSSRRVEGVDVDGVTDQDDWLDALKGDGHHVFVTSGTSGRNSFLPATVFDRDFSLVNFDRELAQSYGEARNDRVVVILGPQDGPHRSVRHFRRLADTMGRPGAVFYLTEDPAAPRRHGQARPAAGGDRRGYRQAQRDRRLPTGGRGPAGGHGPTVWTSSSTRSPSTATSR